MKVSVVVPTYNREAQIGNLVEALERQTHREFETIIINDGSTDRTAGVLAALVRKSPLNIRAFNIPNSGRAGARNFGLSQAKGDLVIFFYDDTRPNPDAVRHHVSCHTRFDNLLISGPSLYDQSRFRFDFNYFRQWMELQWVEPSDQIVVSTNLRINGGNFSISSVNIRRLGGFDERLRDKEDFKLSFDFKTQYDGGVYYYYPTWVYHDDFRDLADYIVRERASRLEEQKLSLLEPQIVKMFPERFDVKIPGGIKYLAARILRIRMVIILFQQALKGRFLLRSMRYRIYDWIITMNVKYL